MRAGDILVLILVAASILMIVIDRLSGASISAWMGDHLYSSLTPVASVVGWLGRLALPFLVLPLLAGVLGGFGRLPGFVANLFHGLIGILDSTSTIIGDAARWLALGLVIVTATVVIQRYVFGFASTKLQESVIYLHALLFLLSAGATLLADGHVRVDIVYAKLTARGKAWTDLIGVYLALIPMSLLILWVSTPYIQSSWRILERSRESDGLPLVFVLKTAIPLFAVLIILQGLAMAMRAALTISGRTPPERTVTENQEF